MLRFSPEGKRQWRFATEGMHRGASPIELYIVSPTPDESLVELLTVIAHFNLTTPLGLGHTVNFGRPWLPDSKCSFGLISLPYLDGPALENYDADGIKVRCLWLIPITPEERDFKKARGLEALEQIFQETKIAYSDPKRSSLA